MQHVTVLLHTAIDELDIHVGDTFIDGTLGGGGHTEEVLFRFGSGVRIVAFDVDHDAILRSEKRLESLIKKTKANIQFFERNFTTIPETMNELGLCPQRILLDIGLSSNQFEDSGRGFSFQKDEPLLMTFRSEIGEGDLSAREIVNTWDEENIRAILEGYGEERFAGRIARGIVRYRSVKPIETTSELVDIIKASTPTFYHYRKIHPATKTFQALRITVNDEIRNIEKAVRGCFETLSVGGRLAVISFHSLEDRVVKHFYTEVEKLGRGRKTHKKPITPDPTEVEVNPRSRSAKLRVIEKIQ